MRLAKFGMSRPLSLGCCSSFQVCLFLSPHVISFVRLRILAHRFASRPGGPFNRPPNKKKPRHDFHHIGVGSYYGACRSSGFSLVLH